MKFKFLFSKILIIVLILSVISPSARNVAAVEGAGKFLIVVSNPLYQTGSVAQELSTYCSDLQSEGWTVSMIKVDNVTDSSADYICPDPPALKTVIKSYYNQGYEGFVLIGSDPQIPTAYWEYKATDPDSNPTDLYYASMCDWSDQDMDNIYEAKYVNANGVELTPGDNYIPDMFYSRISAGCISSDITEEANKVSAYFNKLHDYRINGSSLPQKSLLIADSNDYKHTRESDKYTGLTKETELLLDDSLTTPEKYSEKIQSGYQMVTNYMHSGQDAHSMLTYPNDIPEWSSDYNLNLLAKITPKAHIINMFSCSALRFQEKGRGEMPNLGTAYLFNNDFTLSVIGSTGPFGVSIIKSFTDDIANGMPIGEAFQSMMKILKDLGNPKEDFFGDPTLVYKLPKVTDQAPIVTTQLEGKNDKPRAEAAPGVDFTISTYDPEGDPVTIELAGLPSGAVTSTGNGWFKWKPAAGDIGKIYDLTVTAYNKDNNGNAINKYTEEFSIKILNQNSKYVPAPPKNLSAVSNGSKVSLSWDISVYNGIKMYEVYRNDEIIAGPLPGTNYDDTAILPGQAYTYQVKAVAASDSSLSSALSDSAEITLPVPSPTDTPEPTPTPEPTIEPTPVFKDVGADYQWAWHYINELSDAGIIIGDPDGNFRPGDNITRAEFAKVLVGAFGIPVIDTDTITPQFTDVSETAWYYQYVETAYAAGLVVGYGDATFAPDSSLTREEMFAINARAVKARLDKDILDNGDAETETILSGFTDANKLSDWAKGYAATNVKYGLVLGSKEGDKLVLNPKNPITRAEVVTVLGRTMEKINSSGF